MKAFQIIQTAKSEIGYKEAPGNVTKYGNVYGWNGVPWCVIFAWWCYHQNKVELHKVASTSQLHDYYRENHKCTLYPKKGDIVIYDGHTGLFDVKINDTYFYAIEGNYKNKVARVKRKFDEVKTFIHPVDTRYTLVIPKEDTKKGSKGIQVQFLQRFLNWYLDESLVIDGSYGPLTEKAVKDFQTSEGLKVDGKAGPETRKAVARWTSMI